MHPKQMLKLMGMKITTILGSKRLLIWTYGQDMHTIQDNKTSLTE